jgi:hypothetical protein
MVVVAVALARDGAKVNRMKTLQSLVLILVAVGLWNGMASGAVVVSFDSAHSNAGAGLYEFTLSGAPATATLANNNSAFTITGWAAPAIGNNIILTSTQAPSAWNLTQNDSNNAKWILESTTPPNNAVDGRFEVRGKPNLHGSLLWQFAWPGDNTYTSSGTVIISAIPEPATYGWLAASALAGLVIGEGFRRPKRV